MSMRTPAIRTLLGMSLCIAAECAAAQTLPTDLRFRNIKGSRNLTLKKCPLIQGVSKFVINQKGRVVTPSTRDARRGFELPQRFRFFACRTEGGSTSLYAKETKNGAVTQFSFTPQDFPKAPVRNGLATVCPAGSRGVGGGILYKPAADASDARQGKPAVLLQGSQKTRASALRIYAGNGTEICRFTFKASSISGVNGGSDHYFSGWSGGCGKTGSQLAAAARAASGNSNIFIEWRGGQCLGPVNPTSRAGSIG